MTSLWQPGDLFAILYAGTGAAGDLILHFQPNGTFVQTLDPPFGTDHPAAIMCASDGTLYVSKGTGTGSAARQMYQIANDGTGTWTATGSTYGRVMMLTQARGSTDVWIDEANQPLDGDSTHGRIRELTSGFTTVATYAPDFSKSPPGAWSGSHPFGIDLNNDVIYYTSGGTGVRHIIKRYSVSSGQLTDFYTDSNTSATYLTNKDMLADGSLVAVRVRQSFSANSTVRVFDASGTVTAEVTIPRDAAITGQGGSFGDALQLVAGTHQVWVHDEASPKPETANDTYLLDLDTGDTLASVNSYPVAPDPSDFIYWLARYPTSLGPGLSMFAQATGAQTLFSAIS